MSSQSSFANLITRLRTGDDAAAAQVFNRFARRLIGVAHARLGKHLRRKVDPDDIVQSVFKNFFLRYADGKLEAVSWESRWGLLVIVTLRKCYRQARQFQTQGQDVRKEVPLSPSDSSDSGWEFADREPTPEETAMFAETVEQMMTVLGPRDREVLELFLQGHTVTDIAARLGRTKYVVNLVLKRVRRQVEESSEELPRRKMSKKEFVSVLWACTYRAFGRNGG